MVALLAILWSSMIVGVFRGWTPGATISKRTKAIASDGRGKDQLEIIEAGERSWFRGVTTESFDSVVWKTNGPGGWRVKEVFGPERFEVGSAAMFGSFMRGPSEIHSFDADKARAMLKIMSFETNRGMMNAVYSWYDWDLKNGTGMVVQVCKQPLDPYIPTAASSNVSLESVKNPGTNLISLTLPPATNSGSGGITNADGGVTYTHVISVTTGLTLLPRLLP